MDLAAAVLATTGTSVQAPTSARRGRDEPRFTRLPEPVGVSAQLGAIVEQERRAVGDGTLAVLTAGPDHRAVAELVTAALPPGTVATGTDVLGPPVSVLTVAAAKGLEFDTVVVVEPGAIVAASPRGANDLYVALTRPTQRLHVIHHDALPAGLDDAEHAAD